MILVDVDEIIMMDVMLQESEQVVVVVDGYDDGGGFLKA
jgi:hypothetical protein